MIRDWLVRCRVDGRPAGLLPPPYLRRAASFERLDGGGDRAEVANVLTGTDLAALPLLSIRLTRGDVVIYVLETHARSKSFQRTSYSSVAHTRELIQGPKSR